jgi:iron complex outermembrane recepter protein
MFKRTKVCLGVLSALTAPTPVSVKSDRSKAYAAALAAIGGLCGSAAGVALAQDTQRIEITGSSIKRIASEGALPVITLDKTDIARSGATSVRELVQQLPSMQNFTTASDSVNGGAGGTTTASLRNLGSIYTLVLLNGRRVAPFNSGSTVNLEQLPLAAIERVEVLADGASALYGADAIAGVVNFITKRNSTDGGIDVNVVVPQRKGGKETLASISKGFGDLDRDGFNVLGGLAYEKVEKIAANQRPWSKTGVIPFTHGGRDLYFWQLSLNANPPNVELVDSNDETIDLYSPNLIRNGNCGADPAAFRQGDTCRFDYGSTVEAQPETERKNMFLSGRVKLNKDLTFFGEALVSDISLTGRYAPPAQPALLEVGSALYNRHVVPTLAARGVNPADVSYGITYTRLRDAGLRANEFVTKGRHVVFGIEGSAFGFDGSLTYTRSKNKLDNYHAGGFASDLELTRLIDDGTFDIFAQGTGAPSSKLASAILRDPVSNDISQLDVVSFRASRPIFKLGGGDAYLGFGADFLKQRYAESPSPIAMGPNALQPNYPDFPVGSSQGALPFDTSRKVRGFYGEVILPFAKAFEATVSARRDAYDAASNSRNFDAAGNPAAAATQGNKASRTTFKLGLRFQPIQQLLLRASYGTGFRAPTLEDIADPLKEFGVISVQRDCPVASNTDPLFIGCRTVPTQYKLQTGGNPFVGSAGLKPEKSKQWTAGIVFEPSAALSVGVDVWSVKIDDILTAVPEDTAFDNFANYRGLFSVTTDAATGRPILTFNQVQLNGATAKSTGVDLSVTGRAATPIGRFTGKANVTYLIESYFDYGFGGGKETSIGQLGSDDQVAFRTLVRLQGTLETGNFANTFTLNWKPGYKDQTYVAGDATVRLRNPDGSPGAFTAIDDFRVPSYSTVDWQGRWTTPLKGLALTAGVRNLLDKKPPLSIKTVGGNMLGYDPRYADGRGRTFTLSGSYGF